MASVAFIAAAVAGAGAGVAVEQSGRATPAGEIGRSAGVDISGGAVGAELPGLGIITDAADIDTTSASVAEQEINKRRAGAIGVSERKGIATGLLSSTGETKGGLLRG